MLARLLCRPLHLRFLSKTLASADHPLPSSPAFFQFSSTALRPPHRQSLAPVRLPLLDHSRSFSSKEGGRGSKGDENWKFSPEPEDQDSVFGKEEGTLSGFVEGAKDTLGLREVAADASKAGTEGGSIWKGNSSGDTERDIFEGIDREIVSTGAEGDVDWVTAEGYKPWVLGEGEEKGDVFGIEEEVGKLEGLVDEEKVELPKERDEEQERLQRREEELLSTLEGPNRAFGDLIAASGITEDMIESLILLRDVRGIKGLPPLSEIEDKAIAKLNATSVRTEVERKMQEEIAKARVRKVDEKGRAYGTGRRKCSVARVWVQPGEGKFIVNDKQFDAYFPIMDHRADLLRPFIVTNTLGLWDVTCTVKGGGVSGQVGAVRLGISRALQCWEPGLRPYLKSAGFITRDPRVVERKKPGKAKARKSFQWVKR